MVTVKREPSPAFTEPARPEDIRQYDSDHFGATPPPAADAIVTPQVPWWTPRTKPVPGPQEDFEFEFQVPPPVCPPTPTAQIKLPDRTIPTTLDRYDMVLKLIAEQGKTHMGVGKDASGSTSTDSKGKHVEVSTANAWVPPEGWRESNRAEYERHSRLLDHICRSNLEHFELGVGLKDQQNRFELELERRRQDAESSAQSGGAHSRNDWNQQNSVGPVSGRVWSPPPGWEESLKPQSREALDYLRKDAAATRTSMMEQPTSESKQAWAATSSNIPASYPQWSSTPQMGDAHKMQTDYQMQLMLLKQQNSQNRLRGAGHEQDLKFEQSQQPTLEATPADRESSVDSVWSAQFTPESTPGLPASSGIHIKDEFGAEPTGVASCFVPGEQFKDSTASGRDLLEYELQLAMLRLQSQPRLMSVRTSTSHALNGAHQEYAEYPTQKSREIKNEGEVIQAVQSNTFENLEKRKVGQLANQPLMDRQMRLMLIDQEHKKELMERVPTSPQTVAQYGNGTKGYEAQISQEYENYAKQLQANLEAARRDCDDIAVEYYQTNLEAVEMRKMATPWLMKSWNQHQEGIKAFESVSVSPSTMGKQQNQQRSTGEMMAASEAPNWSPRGYRQELMENKAQQQQLRVTAASAKSTDDVMAMRLHQLLLLEQANKRRLMLARQEQESLRTPMPLSNDGRALQDYQMQLMLLDQQSKNRLIIAKQEQESLRTPMPPSNGIRALQDHQTQLMLLEQANKQRLLIARQEHDSLRTPMPSSNGMRALQDHQTQLMLLEQANKQRLMIPRQEQESLRTPMPPSNGSRALQDYQMQLMLLDQQNKKRLSKCEREAQPARNVKQKTDSISPAENTVEGATLDSGLRVAEKSQSNLHSKPLAFRGRPTCDD